jgi:hypothetical protein
MDNSGYWKNLTDKTRQPNNSSGLSIVPNGGLLPISKQSDSFTFQELGSTSALWALDYGNTMTIESPYIYFNEMDVYSVKYGFGLRLLKN